MPLGVIINTLSVLVGGVIGALLGNKIPERIRTSLPLIFAVASMSMGVTSIVKVKTLPAVVLALIIGTIIGEYFKLENKIVWCVGCSKKPIEKMLFSNKKSKTEVVLENKHIKLNEDEFMQQFVAIVILFCASGTGIFGALTEGMTNEHSILLTKSILDFFTAIIFATSLGYLVAAVSIPQFIILIVLFCSATLILPMTTPNMINDFIACGGILMLATGFRISGIKSFPIANMLPALVIVMPLSYLWQALIG